MWGLSPIDQLLCRIQFRQSAYYGIYTRRLRTGTGSSIQVTTADRTEGVSPDPQRGVIIAKYNDMPNHDRLVPRAEAERRGWFPRDDPRNAAGGSSAEGAGASQMGVSYAVDVNAGDQATPIVYEVDGRQYLVITAGGHHFMETPRGDYVIAYALPAAH